MGQVGRGQNQFKFIRIIPVIFTCGCLFEAGTGWDRLAGDRASSYAESLSFSPVAAWRQGQDGTGWQGIGLVHTQNPCHSPLWLLGGRDRMGRVGRGQDQFIRIIPVILTCGCLEARTGWDGLAGDRTGSYEESLSFSPVAAWRPGQYGTGWQGTLPVHTQNPCHSHLWLLGGRDRMGRIGRGQDWFVRRIPVILTCGCLEAGTGWDRLAGDRTGSYAESL
jgi:hypothetical protein